MCNNTAFTYLLCNTAAYVQYHFLYNVLHFFNVTASLHTCIGTFF